MSTATTTKTQHLNELLDDFGVAMLVTRTTSGHLRGRPMALAEVEPGGTLWFATDRESGKMDELEQDRQVAVTLQSSTKFVSVSGIASAVADHAKLASLWKAEWKVWFPRGLDDPNLLLIRVDGVSGEYWDNSGTSGVKYLIEAGKALITGARPDLGDDPNVHAKVDL